MESLQKTTLFFTILGAINWLLVGLLEFNLVGELLGLGWGSRIVYIIIGICGLINIGILFNHIKPE